MSLVPCCALISRFYMDQKSDGIGATFAYYTNQISPHQPGVNVLHYSARLEPSPISFILAPSLLNPHALRARLIGLYLFTTMHCFIFRAQSCPKKSAPPAHGDQHDIISKGGKCTAATDGRDCRQIVMKCSDPDPFP